jgi:hypothetical protein
MLYTTQDNIKETIHMLLRMKDDSKALINMSDDQWQEILEYMKANTLPSPDEVLKRNTQSNRVIRLYISLTDNEYKLDTLDSMYVRFINDTLREVRKGKVAYAYHTYQIMELLRFEAELNVRLDRGIFYVTK